MKSLTRISGVLSFLLCLFGGLWILFHQTGSEDFLSVGLGLYLVGKAFFVGPMLLIAAERLGREPVSK